MSIITVFKEADTLILSTDSRMMAHDYSGVNCDTQKKIFEIAPGTFIATSGRKTASEFQIGGAQALAIELGTTDIQEIGAALERESLPYLAVLLERLRIEPDQETQAAVAGGIMLHGCMLVGRSGGKLGYVTQSYSVQGDGAIKCTTEAYFDAVRKVACMSGTPAPLLAKIAGGFMYDMATWTDSLEQVSMRFLEAVKRQTPTIGGPWQVVALDAAGAHWISWAPSSVGVAEPDAHAAGTCTATIGLTSPVITGGVITGGTIVCAAGNVTATLSPTAHLGGPGMSIVDSSAVDRTTMFFAGIVSTYQTSQPNYKAELSPGFLSLQDASGNLAGVFPTGLVIGALPSSSPGAGTKRFWYDPADSNRVKYAV
jgi:hypothetical protein